jgi:putative transposase
VPEAPVGTPQAIVTTSDGARHAGSRLNQVRHRNRRLRAKLQRKGTRSARRLLRKRRIRERRFATDTNHCISKQLVAEAERTGRGIALEDLEGIRERVRLRKPQRATLHSWAFHQLGQFVAYKAQRAWSSGDLRRSCPHLADLLGVWPSGQMQSDRPGPIPLRVVRLR